MVITPRSLAAKIQAALAISVSLDKQLDKAYENLTLAEVLDAPVAAIARATPRKLAAAFNVKTVRDLGTNKYFRLAAALADLDR